MVKIIGILAVSQNNAIGKNGNIPWNYPQDLKWFRSITYGNVVVMGSKTYQTLNNEGLDGRLNIVITRKPKNSGKVLYFNDKKYVLYLREYINKVIFIIGGEKIFSLFSDHIEEWFITRIPLYISSADTFMHKDWLGDFRKYNTFNIPNSKLICEQYKRLK